MNYLGITTPDPIPYKRTLLYACIFIANNHAMFKDTI